MKKRLRVLLGEKEADNLVLGEILRSLEGLVADVRKARFMLLAPGI